MKLTMGTAIGTLLLSGVIGLTVQFAMLRQLLGFSFTSQAHSVPMVYGFLGVFLVTDAFIISPHRKLVSANMNLAYATLLLLVTGVYLRFIPRSMSVYANFLILIGAVLYGIQVNRLCSLPPALTGDRISRVSSMFMMASAFVLVGQSFSLPFVSGMYWVQLAVFGFLVLAVFDEESRTYTTLANRRRADTKLIQLGAALFSIGVVCGYASGYTTGSTTAQISAVLELIGLGVFARAIRVLSRHREDSRESSETTETRIWFEKHVSASYAWLTFSLLSYMFLVSGQGHWLAPPLLYDAYLHSATIGFVLLTLMAYEPVLMPAHMGKKTDLSRLSLKPFLLVNVGSLMRVVGDALYPAAPAVLPSIGSLIIGIGILGFLANIRRSMRSGT